MIKTLHDQTTVDVWNGLTNKASRKIPLHLHRKAQLVLDQLNAVIHVTTMGSTPGSRLHKLTGDRGGFWSVSLNDQWRIIFRFENGDAYDVQIVDYH